MLAPGDGGAETFFEKLAIAFQQAGYTQLVVICQHAERRKRLEAAGCEVREIPAQGWQKFLAKGRLLKIAQTFRPTIQLAWMSRAAKALSRLEGCVNLARLGGYYPLKNYAACDHLIGNTPGVLAYLKGAGWPVERMHLISNFGEIPEASDPDAVTALRESLKLPDASPVLLTLGRLHVNKAQDTLIRALAEIPNAVLLIGGEGHLRADLEALARSSGVVDRVRFLGWRRDTAALFGLADLCVFPSREEPLGNVVLEAWAYGLPIVAAASEGPTWLIESGENGLLFPIDDVAACASAVNQLLADPALQQKCVQAGRLKWQAGFSQEAILKEYERFFASVGRAGES